MLRRLQGVALAFASPAYCLLSMVSSMGLEQLSLGLSTNEDTGSYYAGWNGQLCYGQEDNDR